MNKLKLPNFSQLPEKYVLASMYLVIYMFFAPTMYFSQYFALRGMDIKQIGILMATITLVSMIGQFFWGNIADKAKTINKVVLSLIFLSICFSLLFIISNQFYMLLLSVIIFYIFISSVSPLMDTVILTRSQISGINFGKLRSLGAIGFLLASLLSGYLAQFNMVYIFYAVILFGILSFFVVSAAPKVHGQRKKGQKFNIIGFLKNKEIIFIFLLSMSMNFTYGFHYAFFPIYFSNDLKAGTFLYGVLIVIGAVVEIPLLLKFDFLIKKFGIKTSLLFAALLTALRWFFYGIFDNILILLILSLFQGISLIIMHYYVCVYLNCKAPAEGKATVQMLINILTFGLARILGSVFGGFTLSYFGGIKNMYLICTATIIVACVIFSFGRFDIASDKK